VSAAPVPVEASRGRQALAAVVDVALVTAPVVWLKARVRRAGWDDRADLIGDRIDTASEALLGTLSVARELGASPGARIAGIATGDRTSGRRIARARACAVVAIELAPKLVLRVVMEPVRRRDRAAMRKALVSIRLQSPVVTERHRDDPAALRAAMEELWHESGMLPLLRWRFVTSLVVTYGVRWVLRPLRRRVRAGYVALERDGSPS